MTEAGDLLIFKLRGKDNTNNQKDSNSKQAAQQASSEQGAATKPVQKADDRIAQHWKAPLGAVSNQYVADVKASQEHKLREERSSAPADTAPAKKAPGFLSNFLGPDKEDTLTPIHAKPLDSGKLSMYDQGGQGAAVASKKPTDAGKNMTKEESRKLAMSLSCLIHPWRGAYAVCSYCKMGYCFADILEYDDGYYCIEDSGKVTTREPMQSRVRANVILKIAATLFFIISVLLFIYTYKQASFIASNIGIGALLKLSTLPYTYSISILNMLLAVLAIFDAIAIVAFTARSIEVSEVIGGVLILVMSYEYMISSVAYLVGIAIFAAAAMVCVLISKMVESTEVFMQETETESARINWPRLETFG